MSPVFRTAASLLAVAALIGAAGAARGMPSCTGQFSATPLQALPHPAVVAVDLRDNSRRNVSLGEAFTNGLSQAGLKVTGAPNVRIRLRWQAVGQGGSAGSTVGLGRSDNSGFSSWSSAPVSGLQGGRSAALPDFPSAGLFSRQRGTTPTVLLIMNAQARGADGTVYWVASLQCTPQGGDNTQLAFDLGQLLGRALGKRVDNQPM
ncbi:MAG TPA: hypothetical protein VFA03_16280 [Acetobacteraceae bacterium]|nr:hypothetical protein [Acetobacteraceae bacterium]